MDDLLDAAPCGYVAFTDVGTVTAANSTLAGLLGYDREEIVGGHVERLLTVAGRIFYQTHLFPLLTLHGKAEEIFLTLRRKDGEGVPVLANAVRSVQGDEGRCVCAVIPVHQRRKYEDEILAAKRIAEEALQSNAELSRTRSDLERHARELDRKVSRLEQRNAELTRISTILSHDLREPIRKLSVFSGLLGGEDRSALTPMGLRAVGVLQSECARLDAMVRGLQEYVALDDSTEPFVSVDLVDAVRKARETVAKRRGLQDFDVSIGPLPTVQGARRQIEAIFVHLLDNAAVFCAPGVAPRVLVRGHEVQENSFRATEGRYRYVDHARVVVEDNGIGFEERYSAYIFEALRKLDPASPGLGLGLAVCRKVAENHFGSIKAEPMTDGGSRFTVMLPLQP